MWKRGTLKKRTNAAAKVRRQERIRWRLAGKQPRLPWAGLRQDWVTKVTSEPE